MERVFALERLLVERWDYDSLDIYWYCPKQNYGIKYEEDELGYAFRIVKNLEHIYSPIAKKILQERGIEKKKEFHSSIV